jgi:hypothetical protein
MVVARIDLLGWSPDLQGDAAGGSLVQAAASRNQSPMSACGTLVPCGTLARRFGSDCPAEVVGLSIHNPESTCKLIGTQALIQSENVKLL